MKKSLLIIALILSLGGSGFAVPLTGTYVIPGTLPTGYPSIQAAIADLNSLGVGSPGVTFNVTPGWAETFTTPADGRITTLTGTSASPIVFQKSGSGSNPVITAAAGVGTMDAIITIAGCDYVTFDGIDLSENAANINSNTQMEWGYAILKASATDGSQYITIKNCTISLPATYAPTTGIYTNNHTYGSTTQLTVTSTAGTNSYLKIFNNQINNCYFGIQVRGFNHTASPYTYYDQNNEIGKDGGNIITHVGGGATTSYGIYCIYQNNLKVASNNVSSTMSGNTAVYGIYLTTALNASYDLYGNTITLNFSPTDVGSQGLNGIWSDMGGSGTSNAINVYNNTVTNCTFPTHSASTCYGLYLANTGVTGNVYGNTISNNMFGSASATSSGPVWYMRINKSSTTAGPMNVHHNNITGNRRIQSTPSSPITYFLAVTGSGTSTVNVYNNNVASNSVGSQGATHCIYATYSGSVKNVYNNTITDITEANGATNGIYIDGGTLGNIYNNMIRKISATPSGTISAINGIYHNSGTTMYYYNNMISELSCPGSEGTPGMDYNMLNGIYVVSGTTSFKGFYNNTVYLNAPAVSSIFGSSAICAQSLTGVDLRNNILVNTSAQTGTGKTVGIRSRSLTAPTNFLSNYNDIYAGTPGPYNLIYSYGSYPTYTDFWTLADYKNQVTPNDLQSVSEIPPFVNVATSPYDVHIQTTIATQCEKGGFAITAPIAVTTDIDNDARAATPDIGADEFAGLASDIIAPAISYTPFTQTSSFLPRTLNATITDGTGVATTGTRVPVLYWKLNSGPYQAVPGTWVSGSTYSFTFGAANAYHDLVSYYIVAQDTAPVPNVGAMPWQGASGLTANPPACSTPPTTPSSYLVIQDISGVKHVGVGKDYTTLTAAAADLNDRFMSAPVTFILDDNTYPSETFPILFNMNPGNSVTNTLTIKPNTGATPVISGSFNEGLIVMNGLDYVTVDGSNAGLKDKSLTIENTDSYGTAYVFGITNNGGTDPSTNITLKNCVLAATNSPVQVATRVIVFNENGTSSGGGYNNCLIDNNTIKRAQWGIVVTAAASNVIHNLTISNNIIGSSTPADYITGIGISNENTDNTNITVNEIMGPANGAGIIGLNCIGVYFGLTSTNTKITRNKIHDWFSTGNPTNAIKASSTDFSTVTEISNNLIYNIKGYGAGPGAGNGNLYGINLRWGGNIRIWNNTIQLSGPYLTGSGGNGTSSACIGIMAQATGPFDMRDNIFRNSMTNSDPTSEGKAYGIMIVANPGPSGPAEFSNLDYNDYYIDGFNGSIGQQWAPDGSSYVTYPTLASWQAYTGKETNSMNVDPIFVSSADPMDLHPTNPVINCMGGPKLLNIDIVNNTRYTNCDMGAYEWSLAVTVAYTSAATNVGQTTATINCVLNTNSEFVKIWGEYGLTTSYTAQANPSPQTVRNLAPTTYSASVTGLTPNTTYHFHFFFDPQTSAQADLEGGDLTFTTLPALPPIVVTTAATSVTQTGATLNGTVNARGASTAVSFEYGLTTSYGSTSTATPTPVTGTTVTNVSAVLTGLLPSTLYHYRVKGVSSGGTAYGSDLTFTTLDALKTLNFSNLFLEGLYAGESTMSPAYDENGLHWPAGVADHITVELHNSTTYATIEYSADAALGTSGTASLTTPGAKNGSYFVTIKHRNHIETTTANPVSFAGGIINYAFSSQAQAYGNNMAMFVDNTAAVYAGDENQDGIVDGTDLSDIGNLADLATSGYLPQDINGDGLVDGSDLSVCGNNAALAVGAATP